jgi:hypothetical protein
MIHRITFPVSDLCSRGEAALVRNQVVPLFEKRKQVDFDFSGVESISSSYADELFGILIRYFGVEPALRYIRIKNANERCLEIIATAMDGRC